MRWLEGCLGLEGGGAVTEYVVSEVGSGMEGVNYPPGLCMLE